MIYVYEGQSHAFARPGGEHFDQASADAASERTLDHFRVHLG
jgi:carboxymethylenebutenolidase